MSGIAIGNNPSLLQRRLDSTAMKEFWRNSQVFYIILAIGAASFIGLLVIANADQGNFRTQGVTFTSIIFGLFCLAFLSIQGPFVQDFYERVGSDKVILGLRDNYCKGGNSVAPPSLSSNVATVDRLAQI